MNDTTVCHIPPTQPKTQPGPVNLPAIPPAQPTIASLVNTVNQMRQVIMIMAGQQGAQGRPGAPGPAGSANANNSKGTWVEKSRIEHKVRIYQNNDPTTGNFVEVEQINRLIMGNKDTGQTWTWNR